MRQEIEHQKAFILFPQLGEPSIVMSTPELTREMDEVGSTKTDDLGLSLPSEFDGGCLVWEGVIYSTDEDLEFGAGVWRAPAFDEVAAVVGGFCYWADLTSEEDESEDDSDDEDEDDEE